MLANMTIPAGKVAIPNSLQACQTLLRQQAYLVESHEQTIRELEAKNKRLEEESEADQFRIRELLQRAFARRSERYLADPNQLALDFGKEAAEAAESLAEAVEEAGLRVKTHVRRKKKKRRHEGLPEHLPRYEVEAEVPDDQKTCPEHGVRELIGYDTTETLEFERPQLKVRVTKYAKFACKNAPQCGVGSADRPTGLIEGDKYDASIAAEIIANKYGYHLPIYRQQDLFAGSGWAPSRSTLLNILEASAFVLEPLVAHLRKTVLASSILGTDDTSVTLLVPKEIPQPTPGDPKSQRACEKLREAVEKGKPSVTAKLWAYRSVTVPLTFFDFTVNRERAGPDLVLEDFSGKLMADCYSGYQQIALRTDGRIERAACVAHARRKVFESRDNYPCESSVALAKFQQLYDIEDRGKALSPEARLELRATEAAPIWTALGEWLESPAAHDVLPKSKFGDALGYLRNHWTPLQLYLTDPLLPIDNNDVEQLMRQVALGRKNWLFVGSLAAGDRAARFFTLVSSALRNDLDVWAYVKDVLARLLAGETDYATLRPDVWAATHPDSIRQYRQAERRDKADRKQLRRANRRATANA
jgi:transposase